MTDQQTETTTETETQPDNVTPITAVTSSKRRQRNLPGVTPEVPEALQEQADTYVDLLDQWKNVQKQLDEKRAELLATAEKHGVENLVVIDEEDRRREVSVVDKGKKIRVKTLKDD